ncbi:MAG: ORF6N domain-containing protein [Opitutaceae bacterium]|nr:ORF6N domain-containing protein [Opitutaceae bacterium]
MSTSDLVPVEHIQSRILVLRGVRVVLDRDLAVLYGVTTKRLLEQVRRNRERFPKDFCFQLERSEVANLRSQIATSSRTHGGWRYAPYAFTEHGALMAANVLNSPDAVAMSVHVVRAFVRLRQLMANHRALAAKLAELDARAGNHDEQLAAIVAAIRQLTTPDAPAHGRRIGFHRGNR